MSFKKSEKRFRDKVADSFSRHRCRLTRAWNDPQKDIARKLHVQPGWFLVGVHDDQLIATVMVGYEGHRGWINYLAVDPDHQRAGYGRAMMAEAERILLAVLPQGFNFSCERSHE